MFRRHLLGAHLPGIEINAACSFDILIAASGGGGSMLVPPVAQTGTVDRPVGDTVARAQQTTGPAAATTTLWPLAPAQPNQLPNQQSQGIPPLTATPAPAHNQGKLPDHRYHPYRFAHWARLRKS